MAQEEFCANPVKLHMLYRPDEGMFLCQYTLPNDLRRAPISRRFSVSLGLAQGRHGRDDSGGWSAPLPHARLARHRVMHRHANRSPAGRPATSPAGERTHASPPFRTGEWPVAGPGPGRHREACQGYEDSGKRGGGMEAMCLIPPLFPPSILRLPWNFTFPQPGHQKGPPLRTAPAE